MTSLTLPLPPTTKAEAIQCFTVLGAAVKAAMEATEANPIWVGGSVRTLHAVHNELNRAGYKLEDLFGVADNTFSAGGGGPK